MKNALVESRPAIAPEHEAVGGPSINSARKSVLSLLAITSLMSVIALAAVLLLATYLFGSVPSALAFLRGNGLIPDAYVRDFGTANQGQQVSVAFSLTNYTKRPITLLGAKSSCTCLIASDLPVVVQAGAKTTVRLTVSTKSRLGRYSEVVSVLNDSERKRIALEVRGVVK